MTAGPRDGAFGGCDDELATLSAGHGYDYLIRQVAAPDATHRGRTDLASSCTERGETPGRWVGRGLAGVDGLDVGVVVTGEQIRRFLAAADADEWAHAWRLLACGLRRSEVLGLTWPHVNREPGSVTIAQGQVAVGARSAVDHPKSRQVAAL